MPSSAIGLDDTLPGTLNVMMVTLASILEQVNSLPPSDRTKLARLLFEQLEAEAEAEEMAVGQRGLTALTESTRGEDWAQYYPDTLLAAE